MTAERILIVENGFRLLASIGLNLRAEGYEVMTARGGREALGLSAGENLDLVISNAVLPDMTGAEMCKEFRAREEDVCVILVAQRAEETDVIEALEAGADDVIVGRRGSAEVAARVRSRLRQARKRNGKGLCRYRFDNVEVDFERYRATHEGRAVKLTPRESEILRLLVNSRGQLVTRRQMAAEVLGDRAKSTTRSVDNHILRLRRKLEDTPAYPKHILSVYGRGYKFVD